MGAVTKHMENHKTFFRLRRVKIHRDQAIVERFNRTPWECNSLRAIKEKAVAAKGKTSSSLLFLYAISTAYNSKFMLMLIILACTRKHLYELHHLLSNTLNQTGKAKFCCHASRRSHRESVSLESDLRLEEIRNVLTSFQNNNFPEEDGFSKDSSTFFDLIGTHLLNSYNEVFTKGQLSIYVPQRRDVIYLIPKDDSCPIELSNWLS